MRRRKPIRAKAKVLAEKHSRQVQKELEENPTPLEIRESDSKRITRVKTIPTDELKNVIAQTVQRVYADHFGMDIDDVNAREHHADLIVKVMKYGYFDKDGYLRIDGGISMRDHSFTRVPLCKEHRRK